MDFEWIIIVASAVVSVVSAVVAIAALFYTMNAARRTARAEAHVDAVCMRTNRDLGDAEEAARGIREARDRLREARSRDRAR